MGEGESNDVIIARLEVRVEMLEQKIDKHVDSAPVDTQNKSVNRAAYAMIAVAIINILVMIWSTNAMASNSKGQPIQNGIERQYQGDK